ncbi:hypothetical protein AGMMS49965_07000 [Bacteroidia bacterium]|nr:hypothetical protein AGMMS49965_07000 [Bacteroidia bacterium]
MMIEIKGKLFSVCAGAALLLLGGANVALAQITNEWISGETMARLTVDGTLTISGSGAMGNYHHSSDAPWYYSRYDIKRIIIVYGVTSIGNNAFSHCTNITTMRIPGSVTSIGNYAFSYSGLTSLTIPGSVTHIDRTAFQSCNHLTSINVDDSNADYSSIKGVLYNKIQTVLRFCPAGKSGVFTIPDGVKSIANGAFARCRRLTSIVFPLSILFIDDYAFQECSGLTSVTLPYGITDIKAGLFYECSGLTSVSIPKNVTSIENYAFFGCSRLTTVTNRSSVPQPITTEVFQDVNKDNITLRVPASAIGYYSVAEGWKLFGRIISIQNR